MPDRSMTGKPVMVIAHVGWRRDASLQPVVPRLVLSGADEYFLGADLPVHAIIP